MITGLLLTMVFGCINALLSLMPDLSLPDPPDALITAGGFASSAARAFPVHQAILALALAVLVRGILQGWDLIVFIYHQFWGSN